MASISDSDESSRNVAELQNTEVVKVYTKTQIAGLVLGPLIFITLGFLVPYLDDTRPRSNIMLAITLLTTVWWVTGCIPLPIASLAPLVLMPVFEVLPGTQVAGLYMNYVIFLFIGAFLMGKAIEKSCLHERIALMILTRIGGSPRLLLLAFMSVAWLLSMFCSNTSTTALLIPFVTGVLSEEEDIEASLQVHEGMLANPTTLKTGEKEGNQNTFDSGSSADVGEDLLDDAEKKVIQDRFAKGILIGVAFGATSGGIATLIGTPANSVLVAQVQQKFGISVSFLQWFAFGAPLSVLVLIAAWLSLTYVFLPNNRDAHAINLNAESFREAKSKLGTPSRDEIIVAILQLIMVILWFSRPYVIKPYIGSCDDPIDASTEGSCEGSWTSYVDDGTIACFIAAILFFIPAKTYPLFKDTSGPIPKFQEQRLLSMGDVQDLPWGLFLLFGAGFAISSGFSASGLSLVIGEALSALTSLPGILMVLLLVLFVCFVTEFASNTAISNIIVAILAPVAVKAGINPYDMLVPATLAASLAYMFPIATPPNAVVFATGRIAFTDMMKAGFILNITASVLTTILWFALGRTIFNVEDGVLPDWACGGDIGCEIVNGTAVFA